MAAADDVVGADAQEEGVDMSRIQRRRRVSGMFRKEERIVLRRINHGRHFGFWVQTAIGPAHINGDPNMDDKTLAMLVEMLELAHKQYAGEERIA